MAKQIDWRYCKTTTSQHLTIKNRSSCLQKIKILIEHDGCKGHKFTEELAINLDDLESKIALKEYRNCCKTMDMSFALISGKAKTMILAENRFNYRNAYNLSQSEINSKINNSKRILGYDPSISSDYLFIFPSQIKNQAVHVLRRLFQNKSNYIALDINDLKAKYF